MSNEVTIEQMNEVIAIFDGLIKYDNNQYRYPHFRDSKKRFKGYAHNIGYNTDWNMLMPVVEKIEMLKNTVRIYSGHTTICTDTGYPVCQVLEKSKIKATHIAVYKFITWYNDNQQQQNNDK